MADINYPIANKEEVTSQLAEKVQNFKIKNEVVNGDFSQGLINYIVSGNKIGGVTTSNNELTVVSNSQFPFAVYTFPFVSGRKYYIAIDALVDTGAISDIRLYTNPNNDFISTKTNPQPDVWNTLSGVGAINTGTNIRFGTLYSSTAVDRVSKYRRFKCVDLTSIFGTGNEPTKEEMDRLVEMIPNQWWDGELTLTQKQVVTWQLNLIRKNTNAIIALGGTII